MKSAHAAFIVALVSLVSAPVFAQRDPNAPDPDTVKVRFGPISMNPTVTFGDIGVDENVFNEATDPKRDFTFTISPRTEIYLRFLGTYFTGKMNEDIIWYRHYPTERQANTTYGLDWKWPLTRLTVDAAASHRSTRERPGFEIDERAQRTLNTFTAGTSFRLFLDTGVAFSLKRGTTDYDPTVFFKEINLRDELNLVSSEMSVGITHRLTPLTNATLNFHRITDRFPFNPVRDSQSNEARLSVKFDPRALLKGTMSIAYTDFTPASPKISAFKGLTVAADLVYTMLEVTKFTLKADRGLQNSFDIRQPYYVQTGFNLEIAHQIMGKIDIVGRGGLENMDYRNNADEVVEFIDRTDRILRYGAGIGYHRGKNFRLGLNYDQMLRQSVIGDREYERPRVGTSVTYDF